MRAPRPGAARMLQSGEMRASGTEPLSWETPLMHIFRLTSVQERALKKLGVVSAGDLLRHAPSRYVAAGTLRAISDATPGERLAFAGTIHNIKTKKAFRRNIPIAEATIVDQSGSLDVVWFHQPYLAKMLREGTLVRVEGVVRPRGRGGRLSLSNPRTEPLAALPDGLFSHEGAGRGDGFIPVYPESKGVTSNWIYHAIRRLLRGELLASIADPIPPAILKTYNLPSLSTALIWIHAPQKESHYRSAQKRFAFEEVFFIQLDRLRARRAYDRQGAFAITGTQESVRAFSDTLPFPLTQAQKRALRDVCKDLERGSAMGRLLEGDVGSGKTVVAAAAVYAVIQAGFQAALMAPTEILARQHFENLSSLFSHAGIPIGLLTGSGGRKFPSKTDPQKATSISRAQILRWVKSGGLPLLVGTHALIQKSVEFKNFGLAVIDEQHRFGVNQRKTLVRGTSAPVPHLLSMTATPIPRTLALTVYGDLDLTLLDELPPGRKSIITEITERGNEERVYRKIREEVAAGRQAYVICPRINEPDPERETALAAKSVKSETERLDRNVFPDLTLGMLHGKMKPAEKESIMRQFAEGEINILVATSLVEVGLNVPQATIIVIEGAERFGLAQLHQLRGRVLRSSQQAYCFLFSESKSGDAKRRLKILTEAKSGFELAEYDLATRGPGELAGGRQWGISDIGMEAIKNLKMVEAARREAEKIIAEDPELLQHPHLREIAVSRAERGVHFE